MVTKNYKCGQVDSEKIHWVSTYFEVWWEIGFKANYDLKLAELLLELA